MFLILPAVMAIAPALILLFYYYRQDKARPEPKNLIFRVFVLGVLSIIPAVIIEVLTSFIGDLAGIRGILRAAFTAFIVAAFCEEYIKYFVVTRFIYKNKHFDERIDGIVYTIVASLGFACLENILYVFEGGITTAVMRAFTAIPLHALASGIMGWYIGQAKFAADRRTERQLLRRGLTVAILIHGWYDFVLMAEPWLGWIPMLTIAPLLISSFFVLKKLIKRALDQDKRESDEADFKPEY